MRIDQDDARTTQELSALGKALLALVLVASLLFRLSALNVFLTTDEPTWRARSYRFSQAIAQREYDLTYQSEHPGVVTMWIGALAASVSGAVGEEDLLSEDDLATNRIDGDAMEGVPSLTHWARRIVAVVTWLGILILYLLLRRLFGQRTALIATVLVALDPFYLAHSRLHHLDGLLTTFVMLSAVSLLVHQQTGRHRSVLLLSALTAGLAMVNKSPGVLLVPWAAAVLVIGAWRGEPRGRRRRLLGAIKDMLLWGVAALGVIVAIWPALWVDPVGTIQNVIAGAIRQGLNPHEFSNFFWFAKRADPGPAFYPVAWAFRTTPWAMLGLVSLVVLSHKRASRAPGERSRWNMRYAPLLLFIVGYAVLATFARKKFDRYLLPAFPLVDILVALGCVGLIEFVKSRVSLGWRALVSPMFVAFITLGQFALLWLARPYYLAYYNPLVGGTRTAHRVLLVGWGEGLENAAVYLNSKSGSPNLHVACSNPREFKPFFAGTTTLVGSDPLVEPDYFVFYSSYVQRRFVPAILERFYDVETPEYVATVNGLDYVWVYPNTVYRREATEILDYIESQGRADSDVVLLNTNAALRRYYQGPLEFSVISGSRRDDFVRSGLQRASTNRDRLWFLTFPDIGEDTRKLIQGYLEEQARRTDEIAINGVSAVCYELDGDVCFASYNPNTAWQIRLGEKIRLLGYDLSRTKLIPGKELSARFYWQADEPIETSYKVFTHLLEPDGQIVAQSDSVPQGGAWPTTMWLGGEIVLDDYALVVPPDAPPGRYALAVGLYDPATMVRLPLFDETGQRLADDGLLIEGIRVIGRSWMRRFWKAVISYYSRCSRAAVERFGR